MKMKLITTLCVALALSVPFVASAKDGAVEVGNLIYAGTKTSKCFADEFLSTVQQKTSIVTERRFKTVKLASEELFRFPFVVMTGEGDFTLTGQERENMRKYLTNGGFLLASPGCSNEEWSKSFEREIKRIFEDEGEDLSDIPMDHEIFKTIFTIKEMKLSKGSGDAKIRGVTYNGKLVVVFSSDGLNDTSNTEGCCCCGGNEIRNALQINANILAYALLY